MPQYSDLTLKRIARALESTPTAAYTAPHDYPHGAPIFQHSPRLERERVDSEVMRLYLHIPFCNYACSFCCYAKRVGVDRDRMARYVQAVKKELEWVRPGTRVNQFFMGGGTPTVLPADLLDELLAAIRQRMPYDHSGVHTVETSPESMTPEHLEVLLKRGVGRVSMGIQSLEDDVLDAVKRGHSQDLAVNTCRAVIEAGFIMNVDLMYGLPGQSHEDFARDFQRIAEVGVPAVTAYSLRLNEMTSVQNTLQTHERFDLQGLMAWRETVKDTAAQWGYTQTRWHTFKKLDSVAARHERLPIAGDDMSGNQLGVGMSARSSLGHTLYRNHSKMNTYQQRVEEGHSPVEEHIPLGPEDLRTQFIARSLGDGKGLDANEYTRVFGSEFDADFNEVVGQLGEAELLQRDGAIISMTETGKLIYDLVMLSFYPAHAKRWLRQRLEGYELVDMRAS
ncbi:MAG: coproporphyrinogen-III oxidase family protein [Pseudomonadota bacterium]